jgi:hypothetical protein
MEQEKIEDLRVGTILYHFLLGALKVSRISQTPATGLYYVECVKVGSDPQTKEIIRFSQNSYDQGIVNRNPLEVLSLFFKEKRLDRYVTAIPLSEGQFPYALTNAFDLLKGTSINARYLELYPRINFLKEKGVNFSSPDSSFSQCAHFPLLENWNPLSTQNVEPRYEPVHPFAIPKEAIPFFDGRNLRVHSGFYQGAVEGQLPTFFKDYEAANGAYSAEDRHAIFSMAVQMEEYATELKDFMEANCSHGKKLQKDDPDFETEMATFKKVALPILKEIYPSENMAVAADEDEETFDADHADYGVESLDGMGYLKRTYFKRSNRDAQQASTLENYDVEYAQMPYFARVGATYLTKNPEAVNPSLHVLGWTDPKAAEIYQQTERTIYAYGFAPDVPDDVLKAPFALYVEKSSSLIDLIKRERQSYRSHDITLSMDPEEYALVSKKTDKNLLVNGAAGTGKTAVLQHRIAYACLRDPAASFEVVSTNTTMAKDALEIVTSLTGKQRGSFDSSISHLFDRLLAQGFAGARAEDFASMPLLAKGDSSKAMAVVQKIFDKESRNDLSKTALDFQQAQIQARDQALAKQCRQLYRDFKLDSILNNGEAVDRLLKPFVTLIDLCQGISESYADIALKRQLIVHDQEKTKEIHTFISEIFHFDSKLFSSLNQPGEFTKSRKPSDSFNTIRRAAGAWFDQKMDGAKLAAQYDFYRQVMSLRAQALTQEEITDFSLLRFEVNDQFASYGKVELLDALLSVHPVAQLPRTLYLDEYENIPAQAITVLQKLGGGTRLELYGDPAQKVSEGPLFKPDDSFEIETLNFNYRNPKAITDFLKDHLGIASSSALGNISGSVRLMNKTDFKAELMDVHSEKRLAFIYRRDQLSEVKGLLAAYQPSELNFIEAADQPCLPNCLNVIPLDLVLGMEFESVYVDETGMSPVEKYIACTRSISQLTVIEK